ncbi:MAG: WYL domain-containing protein [Cyanophyceae cyanobacterium]
MSRKGQSITLSISEQNKARLESLALEFGMMWGDRPNISKLIEAIARHHLQVTANNNWSNYRIEALQVAIRTLIDTGKIDEARELAWLLSERSELPAPFRGEIEQFLNNPLPPWRLEMNRLIRLQQPFRLAYRDAADRLWSYTVLYAQNVLIKRQPYLLCRCEESGEEVAGLQHNWTLRLNRITEAAVASVSKPWEPDLARIPVEFELRGGLAFTYSRHPEDSSVSDIQGDPPERRIVRNIFSTAWFFQEISQYWEDSIVISPLDVRSRLQEKLNAMHQNYQ